jgi:hypothetical protein
MDFGLAFSSNSLFAKPSSSVYATTEILVPRDDTYLLKVLGDDHLVLWLDGTVVATIDEERPVTRSALRQPVRLSAGRHRLLFRLNQFHGRWQASVRVRTKDDQASDVTGVELSPSP